MSDLSHITAAILAGGIGSRLRSAVADRPKGLALVSGRPFLAWLLDQLAHARLPHAVLCTGYMADMMQKELGPTHGKLRLSYSPETSPLGTGGALRLALPLLDSDPVLVINGDSYCHTDLHAFLNFHQALTTRVAHPIASMLLTQVDDIARYGQVQTDPHGLVTRFVEKSATATGPGLINAGIYLLPRSLIESIPTGRPVSLEKETFPALVAASQSSGDKDEARPPALYGYRAAARFIDIGTPDSYRQAESFFTSLPR